MSHLLFTEQTTAPTTPGTGKVVVYFKSDGLLYTKDDAGTERVNSLAPGSSTDNAIARFDGTGGALQNSAILVDDDENVTGIVNLTLTGKLNGAPRGHLVGLELSNNGTDPTNDIDIAAGIAHDSTGAKSLVLASGLTKQLDASWVVGTNQGMLDTGAIADTTYHIFIIMRSDTGVVDILASTSPTAPTMPTNYDYKRRIGSIMRESAAIVLFNQYGDLFLRSIPLVDITQSNPGTSAVTRTLSLPTGVINIAHVTATISTIVTSVTRTVLLTSLDQTDTASDVNISQAGVATDATGTTHIGKGQADIPTNTSAQIRSRNNASEANTSLRILTLGWTDYRGKFDD
jgi:hypothetical protein